MAGWEWMPAVSAFEAALARPGRPRDARASGVVDHDGLEVLRAHDGAQAAAGGGAQAVIGGGDDDRGRLAAISPAGPLQMTATLSPYCPQSGRWCRRCPGPRARAPVEVPPPAVTTWTTLVGLPGHLDGADAQLGQLARGRPAGVGLLDAAGQRALGPHRQTPAVGHDGPGQDARRDDQDVAGSQRVGLGIDFRRRWPRSVPGRRAARCRHPADPRSTVPRVRSTLRRSVTVAHFLSRGRSVSPSLRPPAPRC